METPVCEGGNSEGDSVFNTKPVKGAQMETSAVLIISHLIFKSTRTLRSTIKKGKEL